MRMDRALRELLEVSKIWDAASILAVKYYHEPGTKFVTEFLHQKQWIVVQWVTTYSKIFDTGPLVSPGRVGIARRRSTAFRHMASARWLSDVPEPTGLTIAVRFLPRLGTPKARGLRSWRAGR